MKTYTPYQFALFRIAFGSFLVFYFVRLIPYAGELYGPEGVFYGTVRNSPFPNIFDYCRTGVQTQLLVGILAFLSLFLMVGLWRRPVSALLLYGWMALLNRLFLKINMPNEAYVGWLLLACIVIPLGEPWTLKKKRPAEPWRMPSILFIGAWSLLAVGYTISGIDKAYSPSWINGEVLQLTFSAPVARDWFFTDWLMRLPLWTTRLATWGSLCLEMFFLALCLHRRSRLWAWIGMGVMHVTVLTFVNVTDVSLSMLVFHLFVFDSRWLAPRLSKDGQPIVFFDGVCVLCQGFAQLIVKENLAGHIQLAPLQGATAQEKLGGDRSGMPPSTVMLLEDGRVYEKSDAVIRILEGLGGFWRGAAIGRIIPRPIRDFFYDRIASVRYRIFGKHDVCPIPPPELRSRFLP